MAVEKAEEEQENVTTRDQPTPSFIQRARTSQTNTHLQNTYTST